MIANGQSGTQVDEVAGGMYRISTPLDVIPGGFTFNSYLIADDQPLLFHMRYRRIFPATLEGIGKWQRPACDKNRPGKRKSGRAVQNSRRSII